MFKDNFSLMRDFPTIICVRTKLVYILTLDYPELLAYPAILDYPAMLDYPASLTFSFVSRLFSQLKLLDLMSRRKLSLSY